MQGPGALASWLSLAALGVTATACQAHAVYPQSSSEAGSGDPDDDGDPDDGDPHPPTMPTSGDGTTDATTGDASTTSTTGDASTTSTTGDDTTTATPSGNCGDGVLDPQEGEICDLGYANNLDDGVCTKACQAAYCGDGLVWAGMETCDLGGANNNDTKYGGCRENCELGPRCLDGVLQLEEECDPSVPPAENAVQ